MRTPAIPRRRADALVVGVILFASSLLPLMAVAPLRLERVAGGLREPVFITHAGDGTGRLFVLEQRGRILLLKGEIVQPVPFLDISQKVDSGGEKGLLGLAFHPDFGANGRFFVNYTTSLNGPLRTVIAEYRVSADSPDRASPDERMLLEFQQPFANHNGGMLAVGPDRYLYIAAGDGGSGGDPSNNGQRLDSLLGKLLRLDVDGPPPYRIPADNPFANRDDARGEIWAYGLRNPWRFSFDRATGRLFAGDVGQNAVEEVDLIVRGGNYGWRMMEGSRCFVPSSGCNTKGLILPIAEYANPLEGNSVIGGYVYRGIQQTLFHGVYIFGDLTGGRIWGLRESSPGNWIRTELLRADLLISSFGEDEQGELYVVDHRGTIDRLLFEASQILPQVAAGGPYSTTLTLSNTTPFDSEGRLSFFNPDGSPAETEILGLGRSASFQIRVAARSSVSLEMSAGVTPWSGGAVIESAPPVQVVAAIRFRPAGTLAALTTTAAAAITRRAAVPLIAGPPSQTGIAIFNPGDAPVPVRLSAVGRDGRVESADPPQLNPLPPKGQAAFFLDQIGLLLSTAEGAWLEVSAQGPGEFGVVALLQEEGLLSTVPVTSLP
ncbi:MAG: PQQ-dependent sugar dehydrogenase [Acidobacteria bacterium]|nr:PQQ-dependent sugar dehydrogenase [Acidobacteriota bacterium]